jgi:hypothetical protein
MPQFDKITFFTQIFWLFFFFLGFYFIFLKVFLPKLAAVLKGRIKKLKKGSDGVSIFADEQTSVAANFNSGLEQVFSIVKIAIKSFQEKTAIWTDSNIKSLNSTHLTESNNALETEFHKHLSTVMFYDRFFDSKTYNLKFVYFSNEYAAVDNVNEKSH